MNTWHHWTLTLNIRSPFLFGALEPGPDGFDSAALRAPNGVPIIPGDHIRGHLRHAFRKLLGEHDAIFSSVFGAPSGSRVDGEVSVQDIPNAGNLLCSDAIAVPSSSKVKLTHVHTYPRVTIDEGTGTAKPGALQFLELPALPEATVAFQATISLLVTESEMPQENLTPIQFAALLKSALLLIPSMGALKSSGFGELVHPLPELEKFDFGVSSISAAQSITVTFDRPLLVETYRAAFNAYESSTIVPGGAIKGAVGRIIKGHTALNNSLSQMVFSHAFPLTKDEKPADLPVPLALAFAGTKKGLVLDDQALMTLCEEEVPIFVPDWKPDLEAKARDLVNRPTSNLTFQSRGHVAINDAGVAEDGQLFVSRHVETTAHKWRLNIDPNGADENDVKAIMALLQKGLPGIGRTGAILRIEASCDPKAQAEIKPDEEVLIILETPALLTSVLNHVDRATVQYEAYFKLLLGTEGFSGFKAVAQRSLQGDYLAHRFRLYGNTRYVPFEVTNPGAVFALTCATAKAANTLNQALKTGLPPTDGIKLLVNAVSDWKTCPYMNQNGFGQISNVSHWLQDLKVGT